MMALGDRDLAQRLTAYREQLRTGAETADRELQKEL
jgi:hypothetical protein